MIYTFHPKFISVTSNDTNEESNIEVEKKRKVKKGTALEEINVKTVIRLGRLL